MLKTLMVMLLVGCTTPKSISIRCPPTVVHNRQLCYEADYENLCWQKVKADRQRGRDNINICTLSVKCSRNKDGSGHIDAICGSTRTYREW